MPSVRQYSIAMQMAEAMLPLIEKWDSSTGSSETPASPSAPSPESSDFGTVSVEAFEHLGAQTPTDTGTPVSEPPDGSLAQDYVAFLKDEVARLREEVAFLRETLYGRLGVGPGTLDAPPPAFEKIRGRVPFRVLANRLEGMTRR